MNYQEQQLFDRLARDIWRDIEPEISATTRQMEAQLAQMSQFWDSYPALTRSAIDAGNPAPAAPAPASPAPEPSLAEKLEEMPPDEFFRAMQTDRAGLMAKIAQAEQEA